MIDEQKINEQLAEQDENIQQVLSNSKAKILKEPLTPAEGEYLILLKQNIISSSKMKKRRIRRDLRYMLFRIRENNKDANLALKKFIEAQFKPPMTWNNFTFEWDIGVNDPLTVVTQYNWIDSGGRFEEMSVRCADGMVRQQKVCSPTAFTQQEI